MNKTIIVTGGASGIGYAAVKKLLEKGCNVVVGDLSGEEKIRALLNEKVKFFHTDVTNEEDVENLFAQAESCFKSIDGVFANAGIIDISPSDTLPLKTFKNVIDINLIGVFLTNKYAVQYMKKNNVKGSIVNTGSTNASIGEANLAAYCASKAAVVNLTRSFASEFGKFGIRVNAISPGKTKTPMMENCKGKSANSSLGKSENKKSIYDGLSDFDKQLAKGYVLGRNGEPDEIANAVVFLLGDESSYMTGADILVDGGYTCH